MDSDVFSRALSLATPVRIPRLILILTAAYVALLIAIGVIIWARGDYRDWFFPLSMAIFPALIYAAGTFVHGRALFGNAEPARRVRAWLNLLWLTVFLYATIDVIAIAMIVITEAWRDYYLPYPFGLLGCYAALAITIVLLGLWAYFGSTVFVCEGMPRSNTNLAPSPKLGLSFLLGGVIMLRSLASGVGFKDPGGSGTGWSVLTGNGIWVTNAFIPIDALEPWFKGLTLAGYAAGIVLALLAVLAGVMVLSRKSLPSTGVEILLNASIVIFWFTLTNYYFDYFYLIFVGIFFQPRAPFAIITSVWLMIFVFGTALWFKYRNSADDRGRIVRTALVLWSLPLMPFTIATLWFVADVRLPGLFWYVVGLQIVTACWWKKWSTRQTVDAVGAQPQVGSMATK